MEEGSAHSPAGSVPAGHGIGIQCRILEKGCKLHTLLQGYLVLEDCSFVGLELPHTKDLVADVKYRNGWMWGELHEAVNIAGSRARQRRSYSLVAGWP